MKYLRIFTLIVISLLFVTSGVCVALAARVFLDNRPDKQWIAWLQVGLATEMWAAAALTYRLRFGRQKTAPAPLL